MRSPDRIAITLGDPGGIGPEVTLRALSSLSSDEKSCILLLGPAYFYEKMAAQLNLSMDFQELTSLDDSPRHGHFRCFFEEEDFPENIVLGRSDNKQTTLAVLSIELAVSLAMQKAVSAIVTAPIHKAGLRSAGYAMPGHTEYLAELSKTQKFEMMLVGGPLRVVLVTRHDPLGQVPAKILKKRVEECIVMADEELRRSFGIKNPRIAVCGLNPHAGESGTLGREEIDEIAPAVASARKKISGTVNGPLSSDVLFYEAYSGKYDAQICMYHDQGLIPLKMISRGHGVNVTLGLPFVRTSPDHGTAYDIASQFTADPGSMKEALRLAQTLAKNRSCSARGI